MVSSRAVALPSARIVSKIEVERMANPARRYSEKTVKVLFGSSGNQCAHPLCTNPIIAPETDQSDSAVVAYICHIYAAADNGPRGKPDLTEDERNAPDNLILLCEDSI